jgi:phenylacetate-CoA ligase
MIGEGFVSLLFGEPVAGPLTAELAARWLSDEELAERARRFREVPIEDVLGVLQRTGALLADPAGRYHARAMAELPAILGCSEAMIRLGLGMLPEMFSREALLGRLAGIRDPRVLDGFVYAGRGRWWRSVPVGSVCHVAAGNVFLGAVDSIVHGIVTKNVNLLKVSSQDPFFPSLFFEALREVDQAGQVLPYQVLTFWERGSEAIEARVKQAFDAILLFGGEQAVVQYKNGLSAKTELYAFGPKISFGLVRAGLDEAELRQAAQGFATDVVYWEQQACTACQTIFVEGPEQRDRFVDLLEEALEQRAREIPQARVEADAAVEIRKERELSRWRNFLGEERLVEGRQAGHTIIARRSGDLRGTPLHRTVYVHAVDDWREILRGSAAALRYHMSTAAIAGERELQPVVEGLLGLGVLRFCKPGSMSSGGDPSAPHDGQYLCELLTRRVAREDLPGHRLDLGFALRPERDRILLSRLNGLLEHARRSPFYREHHKAVRLPLRSLDELPLVPPMEKDHLIEHGPTASGRMLTGPARSCYIFCAGGTGGKMKYVAWSSAEFALSERLWGLGFRTVGIEPEDVVVNYMRAGAFWTGFLATNRGLEETGCQVLSMTANQAEEETVEYLRLFRPTVIVGLPSTLVLLAQTLQRVAPDLRIAKVFYGGEHMAPPALERVRQGFHADRVASMGYAAVDVGPIALQCPHCRGPEHHVLDDACYLETDERGDVLLTALTRFLHPIIRYRVGDAVEWVHEPCPCGRTAPRFRLLGRTDDTIKLNVSDAHAEHLAEAIGEFAELTPTYQLVITHQAELVVFELSVEALQPAAVGDAALVERVRQAVLRRSPALGQDAALNLVKEVRVRIVPDRSLERVARTGKVRRIIDRRMG